MVCAMTKDETPNAAEIQHPALDNRQDPDRARKPAVVVLDADLQAGRELASVLEEECRCTRVISLAAETLDAVKETGFDVAVANIRSMAEELSVVRQFIEQNPKLPLIVLAHDGAHDPDQIPGAHAALNKPFRARDVLAAVRRATLSHTLMARVEEVETALSRSQERFDAVVQAAPDAIILADGRGLILSLNRAAEAMFRYRSEDIVGQPLTIIMPERYRTAHKQALMRFGASGQSRLSGRPIELHGLRKDGTEFPLELSLASWKTGNDTCFSGIIRDITERKRAEVALRAAEEQYRSIVENAVEGIFQAATEGRVLTANPALAEILGYDSAEDLIRNVTDLGHQIYVHPDDRAHLKQELEQKGIVRGFETQFYRKDGRTIWVSLSGRVVRSDSGEPLYYLGSLMDITARKLDAERLNRINQCFLEFGNDPNDNINRLTALCGELLGGAWALYSYLDSGLLQSIGRWRTPANFKAVNAPEGLICPNVIARGGTEAFVVRHLPESPYAQSFSHIHTSKLETYVGQAVKRGQQYVGALCVFFDHDFVPTEGDRRLMGIIASAIGVEEERKKTERAVRQAYDDTELILTSLPGAILIVNDNQLIVWSNTLASEYLVGGRDSLVGHHITDLLPSEVVHSCQLVAAAQPQRGEGDAIKQDREFLGQDRVYRYRCFPVAMRGSERPHLGLVMWDTTEERRLQDHLVQSQKLASLGTMVSGMAHEINNPAQAILGMSELILDEDDMATTRDYARDIIGYALHIAGVVRDFASYARSTSREGAEDLDLNSRLSQAVKMIGRGPHFGHVEVVTQFEPLPPLRARRTEIDQLFINMISNAAQAMHGEGRLTLTTSHRHDKMFIAISDTGCGIPKAMINQIFDPFFTTKDPGKGTGLGLSIGYRIAAKYGGAISVASEEHKGTTFTIEFPTGMSPKEVRDGRNSHERF